MSANFYSELAELLDKYDVRLAGGHDLDDSAIITAVFDNEVEDLGPWISANYLRKYFPNYFGSQSSSKTVK